MHAVCLACNEKEIWEHVVLCEKMKTKRDDWVNQLNKKLNYEVKKLKASAYERKIVNKIIKDVRKQFNRESIFWTNKKVCLCPLKNPKQRSDELSSQITSLIFVTD